MLVQMWDSLPCLLGYASLHAKITPLMQLLPLQRMLLLLFFTFVEYFVFLFRGVPAGSAFTAESDQYFAQCEMLRKIGIIYDLSSLFIPSFLSYFFKIIFMVYITIHSFNL